MRIQRLGEDHKEVKAYEGAATLKLDWYFRGISKLGTYVMRYELKPGASEGEHLHSAGDPESCTDDDSEEMYVVTNGEVVVTVEGERSRLQVGDAMYAPAGALHGIANESDRPAEFILVFGKAV